MNRALALGSYSRVGRRAALALLSLGIGLCWASPAAAYCRTTTCIPGDDCEFDVTTGCALTGTFLEWKRPCISFAVQQDASPLRAIGYEAAHSIIEAAYANWLASSCEGDLPSLDIADLGGVSCGEPQYNQGGPNANVWMFRDDRWESGGGSSGGVELAITIITFHPDTGEIFDADVEINSNQIPLTTSDQDIQYDLASIVTHEAGHFLGLSHSRSLDATMRADYRAGTTSLRHLSEDDQAGMCAIYPPNREVPTGNCTPRHGFTSACYRPESGGCSITSAAIGRSPLAPFWAFAAVGAFAGGAWARRRTTLRSARG